MINKAILIGRLGRDPSLRTAHSGKQVCTFTLATDTGFGDSKKTDWHQVVTFEKTAENCDKFLRKGSLVYVEGRIAYDTYEKDGIKRNSTRIIASDVRFLSSKTDNLGSNQPENGSYPQPMSDDTFEGYPLDNDPLF